MLKKNSLQRGEWVEIQQPNMADIQQLRKMFPEFHPTNLEDSMQKVTRAKLDLTNKYVFISVTVPFTFSFGERAKNFELSMFLTENAIVTVTPDTAHILQKEKSETESIANVTLPENPQLLAYRFFEVLYDTSAKNIEKISQAIDTIDQNILDVTTSNMIRNISILSRNIIYFLTTLETSIPYFEELENKNVSFGTTSMKEYWGDILDKLRSQKDLLEDYEKLLSKLAKTHENLLTHHTNGIIKILTVFSVLLLPLNLVASIYGMNFTHLPGAHHPTGFYLALISMAILGVGLYAIFKYKKLI